MTETPPGPDWHKLYRWLVGKIKKAGWDRQAVPFLGPCSGSFFEVFCIKVAEAQRFSFNEAL